ncbi:MAG: hypothetical protein FJW40_02970 [Acidobacteria bacterium]|nr:hypothetical protein [Acidobacteriota bacterium]
MTLFRNQPHAFPGGKLLRGLSPFLLLLFFDPGAARAQISNVRVLGVSPTQAILAYSAPDGNPCQVEASESPALTPLIHDVNPVLFPGADTDNRASWTPDGTNRIFVVGRHGMSYSQGSANPFLATDGRRYSRALQADMTHYYRITCGVHTATGEFRTPNIPLGKTYPEMLPSDHGDPGHYNWPDPDWSPAGQAERIIDPLTGALIRRITTPQWAQSQVTARNPSSCSGPSWSGTGAGAACGATSSAAPATTHASGNTGSLYVNLNTRSAVSFNAYETNGITIEFRAGFASAATGVDRFVDVCLTNNGTNCDSDVKELDVTTCSLTTYSCSLEWSLETWRGDRHYIDGILNRANFGILITPRTATQPDLTLEHVRYNLEAGWIYNWTSAGSEEVCSFVPVVKNGQTFYFCFMMGVGSPATMVSINTDTGDVYRIGPIQTNAIADAPAGYNIGARRAQPIPIFDGLNARRWYLSVNDATGKTVVVMGEYTGEVDCSGAGDCPAPGGLPNISSSKMRITVLTPGGSHLVKLIQDFDPSYNTYWQDNSSCQIVHQQGGFLAIRCWVRQDGLTWWGVFDPGDGQPLPQSSWTNNCTGGRPCVRAFTTLHKMPLSRWCGGHSVLNAGPDASWFTVQMNRLVGLGQLVMSGPYQQNSVNSVSLTDTTITVPANPYMSSSDPRRFEPFERLPRYSVTFTGQTVVTVNASQHNYTTVTPAPIFNSSTITCHDTTVTPAALMTPAAITTDASFNITITFLTARTGRCVVNAVDATGRRFGDAADGYLMDAQPNDMFYFDANGDGVYSGTTDEMFELVAKTGNTWTIRRIAQMNGNSPFYPSSLGFTFSPGFITGMPKSWPAGTSIGVECRSKTMRRGDAPHIWWNPFTDPTGTSTVGCPPCTDPKVASQVTEHFGIGGHLVARVHGMVTSANADGGCPNVLGGPVCYSNQVGGVPNGINQPPQVFNNAVPPFSGFKSPGSGNDYQQHPSYHQSNASSHELQSPFVDVLPFMNGSGPYNLSDANLVPGTTATYKVVPANVLDRKFLPTLATCGERILRDISSPQTGSLISDATPYTYCVANKPGECRPDSAPGDVYTHCPNISLFNPKANCANGANSVAPPNPLIDLCVGDATAYGQAVVQFGAQRSSSFGEGNRTLSYGFGIHHKTQTLFHNAKQTPDNKWLLFPAWRHERADIYMARIPPYPGRDSATRSSFVPVNVRVQPPPGLGVDNVVVAFGYEENGAADQFFCTSRQEECVRGNHTGNNYAFASETYTGQPCTGSCTVTVPGISHRIVYYRIRYRNALNQVIASSAIQAEVVP